MKLFFSIIIPVYNRPEELGELLESISRQNFEGKWEIILVEDGSTLSSEKVFTKYKGRLPITYFFKDNTGPGDSRNFGMKHARGNYYILLDSDCLLPPNYLSLVHASLEKKYTDGFGGPDAAHPSFTIRQKAINHAMTSFWTTGGLRGGAKSVDKFQPRSFNMGLSREAFEATGGFGNIHPGEDPDLSLRLWRKGYQTKLIKEAVVFHKRRIDFVKFFQQVKKFGKVRPILNKWHPGSSKISYWFPSLFMLGLLISCVLAILGIYWLLWIYLAYFVLVFVDSLIKNKHLMVAGMSIWAILVQFTAYGYGFLKSTFLVNFSGKEPQQLFPRLFFKPKL